jgi:hypothetical protein
MLLKERLRPQAGNVPELKAKFLKQSTMVLASILPRVFFSEGIAPQFDGSHGVLAQAQACVVVALLVLGCMRAASATSAALRYIWRQFLRPGKKLSKYGAWAIVTGGTDGIGREYANCLAKQGELSRFRLTYPAIADAHGCPSNNSQAPYFMQAKDTSLVQA